MIKYYTVYKVTNIINGKFYIGKHITENPYDDYMGSGKLIKKAIKKYGEKNFLKEVLKIYDNEHDMNVAEEILIDLTNPSAYNLQPGGKGGWNYINKHNLANTDDLKKQKSEKMKKFWTEEKRQEQSEKIKKYNLQNGKDRYSIWLEERYSDPVFIEKFKNRMKEVNAREDKVQRAKDTIKKRWKEDEQFIKKMKNRKPRGSDGSALKEKWKDPVWREYMLSSRRKNKKGDEKCQNQLKS